jgi:hypothetical protein
MDAGPESVTLVKFIPLYFQKIFNTTLNSQTGLTGCLTLSETEGVQTVLKLKQRTQFSHQYQKIYTCHDMTLQTKFHPTVTDGTRQPNRLLC